MLKPKKLIGIYNLLIEVLQFILPIFGRFNTKLKQGIEGRKKTLLFLKKNLTKSDTVFWFHCASLGEYEQGLPVFEQIKAKSPKAKIVLSFFSPSGFEIKQKNPITPLVVYLPLDTKKNVRKFLDIVHPELVIFVKYDLWPNYLRALGKSTTKTFLVSALFRESQYFFKWYGGFWRSLLFCFDHIFTQNIQSKHLLESIGYEHATVSKDTRFDRVKSQLNQDNRLKVLESFLGSKKALVVGSSWPEDDFVILPYIKSELKDLKCIIAPHNINRNYIERLKKQLGEKVVLYSEYDFETGPNYNILIVDTIGILSKIYSYAAVAYIGGGMGTDGLHNTLEAAVFEVPIIIGKNFNKFPEAKEMKNLGGLASITSTQEFRTIMQTYMSNETYRMECGKKNGAYISNNSGATQLILNHLNSFLK